jgi:hypothetical protein
MPRLRSRASQVRKTKSELALEKGKRIGALAAVWSVIASLSIECSTFFSSLFLPPSHLQARWAA